MNTAVVYLVSSLLLFVGAPVREPRNDRILIPASDIAIHADPDTTIARYYTMSYSLPEDIAGEELELAILEFVVDVGAKRRDTYVNEAPVLEVCALKQEYSGGIEVHDLDVVTRASRPVALGISRRVKVDVTKIVRAHTSRVENHGLAIGSLTGQREGEFTIRSNTFPDGAVARLTIYRVSTVR